MCRSTIVFGDDEKFASKLYMGTLDVSNPIKLESKLDCVSKQKVERREMSNLCTG